MSDPWYCKIAPSSYDVTSLTNSNVRNTVGPENCVFVSVA